MAAKRSGHCWTILISCPWIGVSDVLEDELEQASHPVWTAQHQECQQPQVHSHQGHQHQVRIPGKSEDITEGVHDGRPEELKGVREEQGSDLPVPVQLPPLGNANLVNGEWHILIVRCYDVPVYFQEERIQPEHTHDGEHCEARKERGGWAAGGEHWSRPCQTHRPGKAEESDHVLEVGRHHGLRDAVPVGLELQHRVQQSVVDTVFVSSEGCCQRASALAEEVCNGCHAGPTGGEGGDHSRRGGRAQGHPDVCCAQCTRVVSTVADHSTDESLGHETFHDTDLAVWRHAGKDADRGQ
mmetsp:Transcript_38847/g.91241  ORF Transcript_38847/g.91241 Transcript_38847/m.91241 type:complete len:298 (-) Transcript_38847:3174-4067(-)